MQVKCVTTRSIQRVQLDAFWRLWNRVWPNREGKSAEALSEADWRDKIASERGEREALMFHFLETDDGETVAVCRSFLRVIRILDTGEELPVLALAGVCVDQTERGNGWGRAIVRDAFRRVEAEPETFRLSLFQTGVPGFYERLGAREVGNRFENSLNAADATANPWWDKVVMIYPGEAAWPDGRIDMRGPGY